MLTSTRGLEIRSIPTSAKACSSVWRLRGFDRMRFSQNLICLSSTPISRPKSFGVHPANARAAFNWRHVTRAIGQFPAAFCRGKREGRRGWPIGLPALSRPVDRDERVRRFQSSGLRPECISIRASDDHAGCFVDGLMETACRTS